MAHLSKNVMKIFGNYIFRNTYFLFCAIFVIIIVIIFSRAR